MPKLFHAFVNPVADQAGFTGTKPSDWNAPIEYSNPGLGAPSGTDAVVREVLTANRIYYIRTDGSDSNDGLTNSSGGAWATFNHAGDVVSALDISIYTVTIVIQNAAWTTMFNWESWPAGAGNVVLDFSNGSVTVNSSYCIRTNAPVPTRLQVYNVTLSVTAAGACIYARAPGNQIFIGTGVVFSSSAGAHIQVGSKATVNNYDLAGAYTISGGAQQHILASGPGASAFMYSNVTLTGTPNFSQAFIVCQDGGPLINWGMSTVTGSATGKRYLVGGAGAAIVSGAGNADTLIPGNVDGECFAGGIVS